MMAISSEGGCCLLTERLRKFQRQEQFRQNILTVFGRKKPGSLPHGVNLDSCDAVRQVLTVTDMALRLTFESTAVDGNLEATEVSQPQSKPPTCLSSPEPQF